MPNKAPTRSSVRYALQYGIKIGEGLYREVYKTKRGKWVYKIDFDPSNSCGNADEYEAYLKVKALPELEGVRVPEMHYIDGVLVAEYIEGYHPDYSCYTDFHVPECTDHKGCWINKITGWAARIADLHSENVKITDDGTVYIIDLGFGFS